MTRSRDVPKHFHNPLCPEDLTAASAKRQTRRRFCAIQSIGRERPALHRNLAPGRWNLFLWRMLSGALLITAASTVAAQDNTNLPNYLGPGVLSRGVGDIGMRSGEQVDLRYYAGVSGIVDTNLQPFALDAQGNLLRIHNLYGVQVNGGAYGVHHWKRAQLGLDYGGNYQRYVNSDRYNGSDQRLTLGYTVEPSRRWSLDFREGAGTSSIATSELANKPSSNSDVVLTPSTLLFDSRNTFLQSSAYATYFQSARTSFTFGGSGFLEHQNVSGLSSLWGYTLTGSAQRRMSKTTSLGVSYSHAHYEFPGYHSNSDSNSYHGTFATAMGRFWTFSLEAGVTVTEANTLLTFVLPPELAALFGVPSIVEPVYTKTTYPSGTATLQRKFRQASLAFNYSRGLNAGNGASTTARIGNASMQLSYTGIRKLNVGVYGGYYTLVAIGQGEGKFANYTGSAGFTYGLGRGIHLTARYDVNQQNIDLGNYSRTSTRAVLGLMFSPGTLPLALW